MAGANNKEPKGDNSQLMFMLTVLGSLGRRAMCRASWLRLFTRSPMGRPRQALPLWPRPCARMAGGVGALPLLLAAARVCAQKGACLLPCFASYKKTLCQAPLQLQNLNGAQCAQGCGLPRRNRRAVVDGGVAMHGGVEPA